MQQQAKQHYYIRFCLNCKKLYNNKSEDPDHKSDLQKVPRSFFDQYSFDSFLGKGSFGVVLKVINKVDHSFSAMKIMKHEEEAEMKILTHLEHPNIISYKTALEDQKKKFLAVITDFAEEDFDNKITKQKLTEQQILDYFTQMCKAVSYLHNLTPPIIHGDLKPKNILLKKEQIKLIDFGCSRKKKSNQSEVDSIAPEAFGTQIFLPPEILECHVSQQEVKYNAKMDIWALGVILYKMIFENKHPFESDEKKETVSNIMKNKKNWDFSSLSPQHEILIKNCLEYDSQKRWNIEQILKHLGVNEKEFPSTIKKERIFYKNGNQYEGSKNEDNIKNGFGKMTFKNSGDIYEGNFVNDQREGFGIYYYGDQNQKHIYKGQWKEDMKEGEGKYIFGNGDSYEGNFKNGKFEGKGTYLFSRAGNKYEGEWKNGMKNGKGKFTFRYGDIYHGDFLDDKKQGKGEYFYAIDESQYYGEWENDVRHGQGVLKRKDGTIIYEGLWKDNYTA